jgi:hypothetical protein
MNSLPQLQQNQQTSHSMGLVVVLLLGGGGATSTIPQLSKQFVGQGNSLFVNRSYGPERTIPLVYPTTQIHPTTKLPYVECPHNSMEEMTPEQVAELLLQQEVGWHHEVG